MSRVSPVISDLLVCIYTCEKHGSFLRQFHESILGQYLGKLVGAKILEVYANPDIHHSMHNKNELVLRTQEKYEALSLKTHKMIDYCVHHFDFKHLLKIDVTCIMTNFEGPEYRGREPIDLDKLMLFLKDTPYEKNYDGFILHDCVTRNNAENWAARKGKIIDYKIVFGDRKHLPPFYSGKCYLVSKRFARYISQHGREMAEEHEKYFLGSEDVMIGRLYGEFKLQRYPLS